MKQAIPAVLAVLLLSACGALEPRGTLTITVRPETANATTTVVGPNFSYIGTYEGDFSVSIPAGNFRTLTEAEGYEDVRKEGRLDPNESRHITVTLPEQLRATFDYFTVTRYETARVEMYGLTSEKNIGHTTIYASCVEDGYPNLRTDLEGEQSIVSTEGRRATLFLANGFPYFTSNTVRCSFRGEALGRDVIIVRSL